MKRLIVIPFTLLSLSLFAAPIGEQRAKEIALNFFASSNTRSSSVVLDLEWAGSDAESLEFINSTTRSSDSEAEGANKALIYIYNRIDTKGFVVVAGDDNVERAIIAFSLSNTFNTKDMPEGAKAMLQAWCKQIAAARNSKAPKVVTRAETGVGNVVCQYETALWGQNAPYNNQAPIYSGKATKAGCVATAMAMLCYYHKWPEKGVGTTPEYTYKDNSEISRTIPANELGSTYDYSLMLNDYSNGYTEEQSLQVANLMYDLGTSVKMAYGQNSSEANSSTIPKAMSQYFGYSKGSIYIQLYGYTEKEGYAMLKNNISKCGPTIFRGKNPEEGGHAFILDGYTDANYFSINYGWDGKSNGYYLLPNISFYNNQAAVIGLIPDRDGTSEYRDYLALTSFKSSSSGRTYYGLVSDATYYKVGELFSFTVGIRNCGYGEFSGEFIIAHCDKYDQIKDIVYKVSRSSSPLPSLSLVGYTPSKKLSKTIAVGDCLRVFYRGSDDEEWILARKYLRNQNYDKIYDKVLLCATPQEVAQSLNLEYDKESKSLSFLSEHAIQYVIKNDAGVVVASNNVASHTTEQIDLSLLESGTYTCSFASGGEPYNFRLKL